MTAEHELGKRAATDAGVKDEAAGHFASGAKRYPMSDMPFVAAAMPDDERFVDALEEFLINYGYNTARAYMADLLDIYEWSQSRGLVYFDLTETSLKPYLALMRRRKYSENTIRRRMTAWRGLRLLRWPTGTELPGQQRFTDI